MPSLWLDLHKWGEGYLLLGIILLGASANFFSLLIIRNRELNLILNFSRLLQMQAAYDIGYLLSNIPGFVVPSLVTEVQFNTIMPAMPYILPILHVFLTGSCYTTIALALERLSAMSLPNAHRQNRSSSSSRPSHTGPSSIDRYPMLKVFVGVAIFSVVFNLPRFWEMRVEYHEETTLTRVNNTGIPHLDHGIVTRRVAHLEPTSVFHSVHYFLYYNQLLTFLVVVFFPSTSLVVLNALIFRRLRLFRRVSVRLGREERKTVRATVSLIAIVGFFLGCHSVKVFVNGYQVAQVLRAGVIVRTWPTWVENLTVLSHLLLAFNSSINLLLYCVCDKHFWVIAQKKLKMWFIWPLTLRREFASLESVALSNKETVQTTEL